MPGPGKCQTWQRPTGTWRRSGSTATVDSSVQPARVFFDIFWCLCMSLQCFTSFVETFWGRLCDTDSDPIQPVKQSPATPSDQANWCFYSKRLVALHSRIFDTCYKPPREFWSTHSFPASSSARMWNLSNSWLSSSSFSPLFKSVQEISCFPSSYDISFCFKEKAAISRRLKEHRSSLR